MLAARIAAAFAVLAAGLLGVFATQLPFVAQVVAFAFGLAAASLFTIIFLGIFWKRMNKEGAIVAMTKGLLTTFTYIYITSNSKAVQPKVGCLAFHQRELALFSCGYRHLLG